MMKPSWKEGDVSLKRMHWGEQQSIDLLYKGGDLREKGNQKLIRCQSIGNPWRLRTFLDLKGGMMYIMEWRRKLSCSLMH